MQKARERDPLQSRGGRRQSREKAQRKRGTACSAYFSPVSRPLLKTAMRPLLLALTQGTQLFAPGGWRPGLAAQGVPGGAHFRAEGLAFRVQEQGLGPGSNFIYHPPSAKLVTIRVPRLVHRPAASIILSHC